MFACALICRFDMLSPLIAERNIPWLSIRMASSQSFGE